VPLVVAGQGEDKNLTNVIVEWKQVGINLGTRKPTVEAIREGVAEVLGNEKFKHNARTLSKSFDRYDLPSIFDGVIQDAVRNWARKKRQAR